MAVQKAYIKALSAGREPLDLARGALWAAKVEMPELPVTDYIERIAALAERGLQGLSATAPLGDRVFALNALLFDDLAFKLVSEPEPEACLLDRVIDERRARPAALAMLYLSVGRLMGLPLKGFPFPGRLLIGIGEGDEGLLMDPVSGGVLLSRDDLELMLTYSVGPEQASGAMLDRLLQGSGDRYLLARVLTELQRDYAHAGALEKALEISDCLLVIRPRSASAHRERARLFERLDCHHAAHADYLRYLELAPKAVDGEKIAARMARLGRLGVTLH
ncbi:transglutaminase family protein [Thiohalomonas denitrificans]|uniref:Regulator of sirC expression, contains transglutaminase-like and TPR domains n=1 Tax=Thiohalomonas denitrificans TaxID=415747 RepID=A0A1G5PR45_9GAMM|nr:tetratricopeptide repeat protein [Thiohalomonas denitrificans]SCZ51816.1 Regulator of sirC expression, contains transglutaminase-like and TPR domains [Thiohalomonas denitrificans]